MLRREVNLTTKLRSCRPIGFTATWSCKNHPAVYRFKSRDGLWMAIYWDCRGMDPHVRVSKDTGD
jgi:hypothetical protein